MGKPLSFRKQNPVYTKLVCLFLFLGFIFYLYSSNSADNLSVTQTPFVRNSQESSLLFTSNDGDDDDIDGSTSTSNCNLFKGDWVPNPTGPAYNNNTCRIIEDQQNCMTNGRPDSDYLYWKWKPRDCELPKFNPTRLLNLMRNKSFAFIGDSILRNQAQSLLCILSQVEVPEKIYEDGQKKSSTWVFHSYNFTVARIWAPFLLKAEIFEDNNGVSTADLKLHFDKLDEKWTDQYEKYDYVMFAGGQWFLKASIYYENNKVQGCHFCPGKNLEELGFDYGYRRALNQVFKFMSESTHKPMVLFRTITSSHFENGEWHNGGYCKRKVPYKEGEVSLSDADRMLYEVEIQEFNKAVSGLLKKEVNMKLLDITHLALLRPDGHPGPYRNYQPFAKVKDAKVQNDCLHWCLPGPIDSWNELMLQMLMTG